MSAVQNRQAVVLLSGGLDSTTTAALAKSQGYRVHALFFAYGQRHAVELSAARRVVSALSLEHFHVVPIDLRTFGGSALTADIAVPKSLSPSATEPMTGPGPIPITYVPARNTVFLSLALAYAEAHQVADLFIGVNALDYSGYPDCRPAFIAAFQELANVATKAGVEGRPFRLHAPLIHMAKGDIIKLGVSLGVDYSLTHSCYDPDDAGRACGRCESCLLRRKGFEKAGVRDPTIYREYPT